MNAHLRLRELAEKARMLFERIREHLPVETKPGNQTEAPEPGSRPIPSGRSYTESVREMLSAAAKLPELAESYTTAWPAESRTVVPGADTASRQNHVWAPVFAWIVLRNLPWQLAPSGDLALLFDNLLLRHALAEIFSSLGMEGQATWQAAAQVRLLLTKAATVRDAIRDPGFWQDGDVRWLAGVNESDGKTYFNKERFEELLTWLQLPVLIRIARISPEQTEAAQLAAITAVEHSVAEAKAAAMAAGFELDSFLASFINTKVTIPS